MKWRMNHQAIELSLNRIGHLALMQKHASRIRETCLIERNAAIQKAQVKNGGREEQQKAGGE